MDDEENGGPDGLTSEQLQNLFDQKLLTICNRKLELGFSTIDTQKGTTTLILKNDNPESPSEFRPITIISILTRGQHKVKAKRLANEV